MMKLVVLTCLVAAATAGFISPLPYSSLYGYAAAVPYAAALPYSAPLVAPYNYRGPLSLAPGQPANILGADGRPLDTLDVNLDRSAHLTAKALNSGIHLLKKRSVFTPVIGPSISRVATPYVVPSNSFAYRYAAARLSPYTYAPTVYSHFY